MASLVIVAALGALGFVPFWTRRLASRRGWTDHPREDRHSGRAVPRTGGAGWLSGWGLGLLLAGLLGSLHSASGLVAGLVIGLAFLLGVLDDQGRTGPLLKGALALLLLGVFLRASLHWVDFGGWSPGWFAPGGTDQVANLLRAGGGGPMQEVLGPEPLRFLFVLAIAGTLQLALQIFDNLDGVVGGTALVGCLHIGVGAGSSEVAVLGVIGAGACLGFLAWNRPPASVYLGNAGSQAVGLLCAGLVGAALLRSTHPANGSSVLLPFAWPLVDLAFVVTRRVRAGRAPWIGGRDHTTHLLARRLGGDLPAFVAVITTAMILAGAARVLVSPRI